MATSLGAIAVHIICYCCWLNLLKYQNAVLHVDVN
jgi:hypothetical protein